MWLEVVKKEWELLSKEDRLATSNFLFLKGVKGRKSKNNS